MKKLLVYLLYYITFVVVALILIGVGLSTATPVLNAVDQYFVCEAPGYVPGKCDEKSFQRFSYSFSEPISVLVYMMFPVVHLLFVVNLSSLQKRLQQMCPMVSRMLTVTLQ